MVEIKCRSCIWCGSPFFFVFSLQPQSETQRRSSLRDRTTKPSSERQMNSVLQNFKIVEGNFFTRQLRFNVRERAGLRYLVKWRSDCERPVFCCCVCSWCPRCGSSCRPTRWWWTCLPGGTPNPEPNCHGRPVNNIQLLVASTPSRQFACELNRWTGLACSSFTKPPKFIHPSSGTAFLQKGTMSGLWLKDGEQRYFNAAKPKTPTVRTAATETTSAVLTLRRFRSKTYQREKTNSSGNVPHFDCLVSWPRNQERPWPLTSFHL